MIGQSSNQTETTVERNDIHLRCGTPSMKTRTAKPRGVVLTIGHSTRELALFLGLLRTHGVTRLVDVRTIPRSWHNPQFNKDTLPDALRSAGVGYQHMPGLGGLRHACPDSPNKAWRNLSFRGYADYMQTPEFQEDLQVMMGLARKERVALMCAEAVPWRCHRSLIADALVAWGFEVEHIMSATHCQMHAIRPWAVVKGKRVTYPPMTGLEPNEPTTIQAKQQSCIHEGDLPMAQDFKVADQVGWNSEAGRVRGTIKKKITSAITFKGYTVRASKEEPQYLIKSDTTDHLAMHKGSALKKISKSRSRTSARIALPRPDR
jgi:hypothetical protein